MRRKESTEKFDWSYFIRHIAIIAVPVALQNLLTTTGSMVDTMMLASLGDGRSGGTVRSVFQSDVCRLLGLCGRRHVVFLSVLGSEK